MQDSDLIQDSDQTVRTDIATKKVENNGMAGNLHGNQQKNTKFSLTSAELHMTNFYKRRYNTGVEPAGKERS